MKSRAGSRCCAASQMAQRNSHGSCLQGALQFVLLMPVLGVLSVILYATHHYTPGYWGPKDG